MKHQLNQMGSFFRTHATTIKNTVFLAYITAHSSYVLAANPLVAGPCKFYNNYLNNEFYAVLAGLGGMGIVGKFALDEGDNKWKSSGFKWAAGGGILANIPTIAGWATGGTMCSGYSTGVSGLFSAADSLMELFSLIA